MSTGSVNIKLKQQLKKPTYYTPRCRASEEYCEIKKGDYYISITGWGAGGSANLCVCMKHSEDFLKQAKQLFKDIKKLNL